MIKRTIVCASVLLFAGASVALSAQAQEKTRAQVRQELIEAESNGLHFVTETSYPDVNPMFVQQVARLKQQKQDDSGTGAEMTGASGSGNAKNATPRAAPPTCVGPISYCEPYFGS